LFDGKAFFGMVVSFNHPFFSIVYEDADFEEVSKSDLKKVLWEGMVPMHRQQACIKHAKQLGMLSEEVFSNGNGSTQNVNTHNGMAQCNIEATCSYDMRNSRIDSVRDLVPYDAPVSGTFNREANNTPCHISNNRANQSSYDVVQAVAITSHQCQFQVNSKPFENTSGTINGGFHPGTVFSDLVHDTISTDRKRLAAAIGPDPHVKISPDFDQKCKNAGLKYTTGTRAVEVIEILDPVNSHEAEEVGIMIIDLIDSDDEQEIHLKRAKMN